MFTPPFRWNLANQTLLGSLVQGERAATYDCFLDDVLRCCSCVLAFAGDSDLVFVGRSPESIFDHLSGLLLDTCWAQRLVLLQFSMRWTSGPEVRQQYPGAMAAIRSYLQELDLHPSAIAQRSRPVTFVDLVASGGTFGQLITLLHQWSQESCVPWNDVRRKIRLVGITRQGKNSPNTRRWHQHAEWLHLLPRGTVINASIPPELWDYLGNWQYKVTRSHTPAQWANPNNAQPFHGTQQLMALRLAFDLFELGRAPERRGDFARLLAQEPAMRHGWFRALVQEVRT